MQRKGIVQVQLNSDELRVLLRMPVEKPARIQPKEKETIMKRNTTKKTDRKTVAAQKNDKIRKNFRTGVKAGLTLGDIEKSARWNG